MVRGISSAAGTAPALCLVAELRHNMAVPPDQRLGLLPLPRPRRHRVLPVFGRHPPVKREQQPAARASAGPPLDNEKLPGMRPASPAPVTRVGRGGSLTLS